VSFVLLVVVESIAVLVIPILYASAVIPVTTAVPEKNATKSVNLLVVAAVVVVRVVKEEREEKVATTVDLLVATTAAAADSVATMEERVEKVEKEERVDTTVAVVDTKFVNSSVNWFMTNIRRTFAVGCYIFHSCGTGCHSTIHQTNERMSI